MSNAPDASYKEMAQHCETLLMGKQEKMSYLINTNPKQGTLLTLSPTNSSEVEKHQTASNVTFHLSNMPSSQQCAAEYHHPPPSFRLPASSPYDNFLKAAGC